MKKLILSFCLLLLSISASANNYYKKLPAGEFEVTEKTVNTKEKMLDLVNEWFAVNFKPSEYELQQNDYLLTISWTIKGEPFSKYTECDASAVYIIDIKDNSYTVKVRKPQCQLKPKGYPHQYVLPYRRTIVKELEQFISINSEKYFHKSLTWDDNEHLRTLENELYEESLRLPRKSDGTPKPNKRYFIMIEKHNLLETVTGSLQKAHIELLESLHKILNQK